MVTGDTINGVVKLAEKAVPCISLEGRIEKYCTIITLYMRSAFHLAQWQRMIRSLSQLNVVM